jgi:hypothetical protein
MMHQIDMLQSANQEILEKIPAAPTKFPTAPTRKPSTHDDGAAYDHQPVFLLIGVAIKLASFRSMAPSSRSFSSAVAFLAAPPGLRRSRQ